MQMFGITANYVINADETPICLESHSNYTYDQKNNRDSIPVISFNKEKQRLSFLLSVTADGTYHKPFVVIKGKMVNRLVGEEVLNNCCVYANQTAWLNSDLIKNYIEDVIVKYTERKWSILLWDHFSCHYHREVINLCLDNHIIVIMITPRTTSKL